MADWEPAFRAWRELLASDDACDFDAINPEPEVLGWLETVFAQNGAVPVIHLGPFVLARRVELATEALDRLRDAYERDHGARAALTVRSERPMPNFEMGLVFVDQTPIRGMSAVDVLVETADGLQEYVAGVYWHIWPECPAHRCGVHPRRAEGRAVWQCLVGDHVVAEIDTR